MSTCSPLQYFNHISIEDSRVYELTNKAGLLSPYQILHECLKRWEALTTIQLVQRSFRFLHLLRTSSELMLIEYLLETMEWETPALNLRWSPAKIRRASMWWHAGSTPYAAGVSTAWPSAFSKAVAEPDSLCVCVCVCRTLGKNKRVGKQLASQKILQMLHPHVKNWGSLLRMYGRENNKMVKKVRSFKSSVLTRVHTTLQQSYRNGFGAFDFICFPFCICLFYRRTLTRVWSSSSSMPKRTSQTFISWTNCKKKWGN